MISDAHIHLDKRLKTILLKHEIPAIINCATPSECEEAITLCKKYPYLSYSCGVHPWDVDTITLDQMMPYMIEAKIIGEIGMDNVWCKQDRNIQLQVFQKQLIYASTYKKPVILHTKGEEKTIIDLIKKYPNTYLVHWYSCINYLQEYKELDCYFSVGPDVHFDMSVQQVVKEIQLDHLLIESDGISAIEWALGPIKNEEYQSVLFKTLAYIADIKHLNINNAQAQIEKNYQTLLHAGRK